MDSAHSVEAVVRSWWQPTAAGLCLLLLLVLPAWIEITLAFALALNAGLLLGWSVLQLRWRWLRLSHSPTKSVIRSNSSMSSVSEAPFFSVHVPAHDEPASMLRQTLSSLAHQHYDRYEVLVIDNNTISEVVWRPVEALCRALGQRFTFVHRMNVQGAKAGALNITRQMMNPRTTHVVVVDADYQVSPGFLAAAADALIEPHIGRTVDYVQFPQAYRSSPCTPPGLAVELTDYFDRHATFASDHSAMLLTGTLSIISVHALDAVGGWPTASVTEDAELGMHLQAAGFSGRFVNSVHGRGLLPPGVGELQGQRHRWIVGNLHTLIRSLHLLPSFSRNRQRAMVAQLTAWCSFTFIPAAALSLLTVRCWTQGELSQVGEWSLLLAAGSVCWQAMVSSAVFLRTSSLRTSSERFEACLIRWSLSLSSGWSTLSALAMTEIKFLRTSRNREHRHAQGVVPMTAAMLLLMTSIGYLIQGVWLVAVAVMLFAAIPLLGHRIDRRMQSQDRSYAVTS